MGEQSGVLWRLLVAQEDEEMDQEGRRSNGLCCPAVRVGRTISKHPGGWWWLFLGFLLHNKTLLCALSEQIVNGREQAERE
jgi:hypothetical protein